MYANTPDSIGIFEFEEDVAKQAAFCTGAAGPSGVNADALKEWLLQYGAHLEALRLEMVEWACVMANESPCYGMYRVRNACRMLAADKEPGVRPLACGESFMHLLARCALVSEAKTLAWDACNNVNLGGGLQSGIEGNLHAIRVQ